MNLRILFSFCVGIAIGVGIMYLRTTPIWLVPGILFGVEKQSKTSIPGGHIARVYSRSGAGDQTFLLFVDGAYVFQSSDLPPGDLHEQIIWDASGQVVSLYADGEKLSTYDADRGIEIKE